MAALRGVESYALCVIAYATRDCSWKQSLSITAKPSRRIQGALN